MIGCETTGYAGGGDEVFLLCEKINKDDIQVRFFEETEDGISWEAFGDFASHDVHRQYAIVFRTPPYRDPNIQNSVQVFIQLRRPSDDETGDPKPFQYIPQDLDPYGITNKRKMKEVNVESFYSDRIPLSVWHEVKDESEAASSGDVKSRLKKKAVSGLQRKDKAASSESTASASATAESSAAAQLLVNTMYPSTSPVSNTAAVRQITPSTPIVLSAEALTCLLTMNQQQTGQSQPLTPSVELSNQILQFMADQAAGQAISLSMDSVNIPAVTELSANSSVLEPMSNDLDVGAQEVLEEGAGPQKQHPLHIN